ncbi:MAG: hypothetical protein AAF936_01385 [Pseudomonadota bacterium]
MKTIIGDPFTQANIKSRVLLAVGFVVFSVSPIMLAKVWPERFEGKLVWALLIGGVFIFLHEAIQYFIQGRREGETGSLVIDERGIGGKQLFSDLNERIEWSRIKNVSSDESAVILEFEPVNMSSNKPQDRISIASFPTVKKRLLKSKNRYMKVGISAPVGP